MLERYDGLALDAVAFSLVVVVLEGSKPGYLAGRQESISSPGLSSRQYLMLFPGLDGLWGPIQTLEEGSNAELGGGGRRGR